jgi:hypothetical protein
MKKPSRKSLVKKLDGLFSLYIRQRDGYCFTCGNTDSPTCGHLFTRTAYSTRWDKRYAFQQCWPCNYRHEFKPEIFTEKFIDRFGLEAYKQGIRDHHKPTKYTDLQLKQLIKEYEEKERVKETQETF